MQGFGFRLVEFLGVYEGVGRWLPMPSKATLSNRCRILSSQVGRGVEVVGRW